MNKYQDALNRLVDDDYNFPNDYYEEDKAVAKERDIDTLQELVDKATPQKPPLWGDGYDTDGQLVYDMYDCPSCDKSYKLDYQKTKRCDNCGQVYDWEDLDGTN